MDEFSLYQWLVLGLLALIAFLLWAFVAGGVKDLQVAMAGELRSMDKKLEAINDVLKSNHDVLKSIGLYLYEQGQSSARRGLNH